MIKTIYLAAALGGAAAGAIVADPRPRDLFDEWYGQRNALVQMDEQAKENERVRQEALAGYGVAVQMLETGLAGAGIDPFGEQTGLGQSR